MADNGYAQRRSEIETYFDRTAADAWERLTIERAGQSHPPDRARGPRRDAQYLLLSAGCRKTCGSSECSTPAAVPAHLPWKLASAAPRFLRWTCHPRLSPWPGNAFPAHIGEGRIDFRVGDMSALEPATSITWSPWIR
jgi:magnesium-protoporphyrin O-methyltransferase